MIPNDVPREQFSILKHKILSREPYDDKNENGGHFVKPLSRIESWRTPLELRDFAIKAIDPILLPVKIEVLVTADPHKLGMPWTSPRHDSYWYKMERIFTQEIAAQVDTMGPSLTLSIGCGRWDQRIIDAVLYHEAGHCKMRHSEVYDHSKAQDCHKAEFEADDFAYDEVNKRRGTVELTDLGMLLRNYHMPTWEGWCESHPSTRSRYRRQALRWNQPTVEELEKTL